MNSAKSVIYVPGTVPIKAGPALTELLHILSSDQTLRLRIGLLEPLQNDGNEEVQKDQGNEQEV